MDEWTKKMWYVHTMEYYSALTKEGNPAIFDNMNEPGWYYDKWNKPVTEVEILHESTYEVSRIVKFVEIESRMVVFRGWGEGQMESCLMSVKFQYVKWMS